MLLIACAAGGHRELELPVGTSLGRGPDESAGGNADENQHDAAPPERRPIALPAPLRRPAARPAETDEGSTGVAGESFEGDPEPLGEADDLHGPDGFHHDDDLPYDEDDDGPYEEYEDDEPYDEDEEAVP